MNVAEAVKTLSSSEDPAAIRRAAAPFLAGGHGRLADQITSSAAINHTLLRTLNRLDELGVDLERFSIPTEHLDRNKTTKVIPALRERGGRVPLSALHRALITHQHLLRALTADLANAHPFEFVVAYGQGLWMKYPAYRERACSDLDVFVERGALAHRLVASLTHEFGFSVHATRQGYASGRGLGAVCLAARRGAHVLYVDLFIAGRPSGGHQWIPPLRYPPLFDRAERIPLRGGGGVLVPAAEDMLLMLAEKVLRKGDYDVRRIEDARIVVRSEPKLDWSLLHRNARAFHLQLGLHWLLSGLTPNGGAPEAVIDALAPSRLDRLLLPLMAGGPSQSAVTARRARGAHRRLWVTRYILHHRRPPAAALEVIAGRMRRPARPA